MNVKFKSSDIQEPSGGEKPMTGDAEKIKNHPLLSKVNTKQEWEETMKTVLDLSTNIPQVTGQDEYDALPSGSVYSDINGLIYTKP